MMGARGSAMENVWATMGVGSTDPAPSGPWCVAHQEHHASGTVCTVKPSEEVVLSISAPMLGAMVEELVEAGWTINPSDPASTTYAYLRLRTGQE